MSSYSGAVWPRATASIACAMRAFHSPTWTSMSLADHSSGVPTAERSTSVSSATKPLFLVGALEQVEKLGCDLHEGPPCGYRGRRLSIRTHNSAIRGGCLGEQLSRKPRQSAGHLVATGDSSWMRRVSKACSSQSGVHCSSSAWAATSLRAKLKQVESPQISQLVRGSSRRT